MSSAGWRHKTRELQRETCLICGHFVQPPQQGSWDHLVPKAIGGDALYSLRVGLAYWTHQKCNSARGHLMPTPEMLDRAAKVIEAMDADMRAAAIRNIQNALVTHQGYVTTLTHFLAAAART